MPLDSADAAPLLRSDFDGKSTFTATLWLRIRHASHCLSQRSGAAMLKPSFLDKRQTPSKIHPTSWLDGVRGYASFFVFVYHFQYLFHSRYARAYGASDEDYWLIQLPVLRLLVTGSPLVNVFFVLSGISLSLKPLQLARSQNWEKMLDTMFSSVFRRWLRLYLPILWVQCCVILMVCLGWYNHAQLIREDWPYEGTNEESFKLRDTNAEQIRDWFHEMARFLDPFGGQAPKYDMHLWTIPFEFRFSIMLFSMMIAFAKLRSNIRLMLTAGVYTYCVTHDKNFESLFIAGMGLAEYICILDDRKKVRLLPAAESDPEKSFQSSSDSTSNTAIWGLVLYIGLHLLSFSSKGGAEAPGYASLYQVAKPFTPNPATTFSCIGAVVSLFALCGCDQFRKPFQTPLAVYLGKISFPLYIVHGAVIRVIGMPLVEIVWTYAGWEHFFWFEFSILLTLLMITPICIWLADLVMRLADTPSVRLGRTLMIKMSV